MPTRAWAWHPLLIVFDDSAPGAGAPGYQLPPLPRSRTGFRNRQQDDICTLRDIPMANAVAAMEEFLALDEEGI